MSGNAVEIVSSSLLATSTATWPRGDISQISVVERTDFGGDRYYVASIRLTDATQVRIFETSNRPTVERLTGELSRRAAPGAASPPQ